MSRRITSLNRADVEREELRASSSRMETRMRILEDHNRQLGAQLDRLRQLLRSSEVVVEGKSQFGTLQSKSVVAAELFKEHATGNLMIIIRTP